MQIDKPSKSELGKISKIVLEDINSELRIILGLNQWKSTRSVTEWFNNIENKQSCTFIQLDIRDRSLFMTGMGRRSLQRILLLF